MNHHDLEVLGEIVMGDLELRQQMVELKDRAAFTEAALDIARRADLEMSNDDIDAALRVARRQWFDRWV